VPRARQKGPTVKDRVNGKKGKKLRQLDNVPVPEDWEKDRKGTILTAKSSGGKQ